MNSDVRSFLGWAEARGWSAEKTNGGHMRLKHPSVKDIVHTASTPSDRRALMNMKAHVLKAERASGVVVDAVPQKKRRSDLTPSFPFRPLGTDGSRFIDVITCCVCNGEDHLRRSATSKAPTASNVAHKFRSRGWRIGKVRTDDKCPSCLNAPVVVIAKTIRNVTAPIVSIPHDLAIAIAVRRKVLRAIDRAYISETIGYVAGESDATIAARLSVDEATVAGLRDANFGPLVEGSEMIHARQEIEALKREVVAFQKTIIDSASKLEQRLVSVLARLDNIKEPVNV